MRGADGGPWRRLCALPAFWVSGSLLLLVHDICCHSLSLRKSHDIFKRIMFLIIIF
jgi:hypothetical protein